MLSRARYRGEHFVIDRNGESVATISPPRPVAHGSWWALAERLKRLTPTDVGFADDIERIRETQPKAAFPAWPN